MSALEMNGHVDPAFRRVEQAFVENFTNEQEIGAAVCIYQDGEKVVDLRGGTTSTEKNEPWRENSLVNVWSTTKGAMAATIARLVDQDLLSLTKPVAEYWPAFASNGKEAITVAQLFSHQAGLCGPAEAISTDGMFDVDAVASMLAVEKPHWTPGTRSGYHALSIGYLAEGLVRQIIGKSVGQYFQEEIGGPLGLDFFMGLAESREADFAPMFHDGNPMSGGADTFNEYQTLAQINIPIEYDMPNERRWRSMGLPSAGAAASATGIAGLYRALVSDLSGAEVQIASKPTLESMLTCQIENEDLVLLFPIQWGVGFALNGTSGMYGPKAESFGHHGWGGSCGFGDPSTGISFGYAMNYMREASLGDPRAMNLITAMYQSLA